jgi:hypothetical protein
VVDPRLVLSYVGVEVVTGYVGVGLELELG